MIVLARKVRDVEPDAAVRRAAALLDLGVGGERDAIAGRQLHALRVVARHEPLAEAVAQDAALAPRRLGDQRAGGLLGLDEARRMELHELRVADPAPASTARRKASPVFSSRREDVRRQIRVWPPAARMTASARMT